MKKLFYILMCATVIAFIGTACKSKQLVDLNQRQLTYEDTVGFAQFQAWKALNERMDPVLAYDPNPAPVQKVVRSRRSTSGTMSSSSTNYAKTTKKKGWSKAAKYAAVGGGGGVILGAVINKRNRVAGGIFGGILGGGLGYVLGRAQDKKDGRF